MTVQGGLPGEGPVEVLVAEDDDDLRRTIELWFEAADGIDPTLVSDGEAAADRLDEADVFVCDRSMPELSGPELLAQVDTTADLPVVVVSAYRPDEHLGPDDVDRYIRKPTDRSELVDAVRDVLT